jgi:hypothetical protein
MLTQMLGTQDLWGDSCMHRVKVLGRGATRGEPWETVTHRTWGKLQKWTQRPKGDLEFAQGSPRRAGLEAKDLHSLLGPGRRGELVVGRERCTGHELQVD